MSETGRAAVFNGPGKPFEIREFPVPEPGDRDVVVKVEHTNVCGSDLHMWKGDTDLTKLGLTYGMVLGHEMVGRVVRKGRKVRSDSAGKALADGDRVAFTYYVPCGRCRTCLKGMLHACMSSLASLLRPVDQAPHFVGGFAEYYFVKGRQKIFKVPDGLSAESAAGANCALSQVIHGFDVVGLSLGDNVVVQGAGGLGIMACAVARELGAGRVIAIDAVPARLELARSFGADEVIDINADPDPRARVRKVMTLTDGEGADVVVEVAGLPEVVPEGIRMLARAGRYLEIGNITPRATYKADPSLLVGFNRSIHGVSLYPQDVLRRALSFLDRTRDRYPYERLASHTFSLDEVGKAFEESAAGRTTRAAVVP
jgi:D-arabinose 1-dehydrogenase-like Zn-dependent alcohol dehydrogenase